MKSIDNLVSGSGVASADEIMVVSRVDATASSSGAPLNVPTEQASSLFGFSSASLGFVMAAGVELGVYLFIEVLIIYQFPHRKVGFQKLVDLNSLTLIGGHRVRWSSTDERDEGRVPHPVDGGTNAGAGIPGGETEMHSPSLYGI